jgi:hypothetical protein
VRYIRLTWFALGALLLLAAPAPAQPTGSYSAPTEFMDLFFDFTGSHELDYPPGQPTLGQMLTQATIARERAGGAPGPLVLVVGSDIYVYASTSGARLGQERFRADCASGFYELTAISHIGPALAYLAQIKANGDARWSFVADTCCAGTRPQPARRQQLARSAEPTRVEHAQGANPQHGGLCLRPDIELYRVAR